MHRYTMAAVCVLGAALLCSAADGITLAFDDVASGNSLQNALYAHTYRTWFDDTFQAADHAASSWGPARSGSNVMVWGGSESEAQFGGHLSFGYVTGEGWYPDDIRSVGAYFSTEAGAMVSVMAYRWTAPNVMTLVHSVVIGALGESWDNRYVQIGYPGTPFNTLRFEGVNSPNELRRFCLDDMTITPVPEPASLLALAAGLAGVAFRRRR